MKYTLLFCLILSSCASIAPNGANGPKGTCDDVIAAEEERYAVCEAQVNQCLDKLEKTYPSTMTKIIWGVAGLLLGVAIGANAGRR